MTDGLTFKMTGLDHLLGRMAKLPAAAEKKLARRAVRKGATVIRNAARVNARALDDPDTTEDISKNIVVQNAARLGRREGGVAMRVGVLGGAKAPAKASGEIAGAGKGNPGGDTYYWRFHEFGTQSIAPRPILRAAIASSEQAALTAIADELTKGLDKLEQEL